MTDPNQYAARQQGAPLTPEDAARSATTGHAVRSGALEALLEERGAILRGHFRLASGRHGDIYVEKFRILQWPDLTSEMCARIGVRFSGSANVVAGPTTGGVILS